MAFSPVGKDNNERDARNRHSRGQRRRKYRQSHHQPSNEERRDQILEGGHIDEDVVTKWRAIEDTGEDPSGEDTGRSTEVEKRSRVQRCRVE